MLARWRRGVITRLQRLCVAIWRRLAAMEWSFVKGVVFDASADGAFLVAGRNAERYVVSANDKVIGRSVYLTGEYDFAKVETVIKLLGGVRHFDLLVDIGANIGVICIPAVRRRLFNSAIAVEPSPRNYELLVANIHLNGLGGKIRALNCALGARDGETLMLSLSKDNHGDNRTQAAALVGRDDLGDECREAVAVRSRTVDSIVTIESPATSLIWMDTQGFEGFILRGAPQTLSLRVPLVLEFWPYGMKRSGCFSDMAEALDMAGYENFIDLADPLFTKVPLSSVSLKSLYNQLGESGAFTDILVR